MLDKFHTIFLINFSGSLFLDETLFIKSLIYIPISRRRDDDIRVVNFMKRLSQNQIKLKLKRTGI